MVISNRPAPSWRTTLDSYTRETNRVQQLFITRRSAGTARLSSCYSTKVRKSTRQTINSALRQQVGQLSTSGSEAVTLPSNLTTSPTPLSAEMFGGSRDF